VHHALAVHGREDVAGVDGEAPQALLGDRAVALQDLREGVAGDVGHDEGAGPGLIVADDVQELRDALVVETLEGLHLAIEELLGLPVLRLAEVEELDGDAGARLEVGADERGALAALAGETLDGVAAAPDVGGEGPAEEAPVHRRLGDENLVVGLGVGRRLHGDRRRGRRRRAGGGSHDA
jgi:hypothetical protein